MSDDDFDEVLDVWVAKQTTWTLFDAVCLLVRINPDERKEPILLEVDDGQTTRYFKYSLLGADPNEKYKIIKENPEEVGAKGYVVDGKSYIEWAGKRWPNDAQHLASALLRYKAKKGTLSKTQQEAYAQRIAHEKVFNELVDELARKNILNMSAHEIWRRMCPIIENEIGKPLKERKCPSSDELGCLT